MNASMSDNNRSALMPPVRRKRNAKRRTPSSARLKIALQLKSVPWSVSVSSLS